MKREVTREKGKKEEKRGGWDRGEEERERGGGVGGSKLV